MGKNVLVLDKISPIFAQIIEAEGHNAKIYDRGMDEAELLRTITEEDAHALAVRSNTAVPASAVERLEAVVRAGVGKDGIDIQAAQRRGVPIIYSPTGSSLSVAEWTDGMVTALARGFSRDDYAVKTTGRITPKRLGRELQGLNYLIWGMGNIGQPLAVMQLAKGVNVFGYDLSEHAIQAGLNIEVVVNGESRRVQMVGQGENPLSLEDAIRQADIISLHLPLNPKTQGILSEEMFKLIRDGTMLLNPSRFALINEKALLGNLSRLGGYSQDVYQGEKKHKISEKANSEYRTFPTDHPFLTEFRDKVILTKHIGGSTEAAQIRIAKDVGNQLISFFARSELAGRMGYFIGEYLSGKVIREVAIKPYQMVDPEKILRPIAHGLAQSINGNLGYFEALEKLSEATDFELNPSNSKLGPYSSSLSIEVTTDSGTYRFVGVNSGNNGNISDRNPRMVYADGYTIDANLRGQLTLVQHLDCEGAIHAVTGVAKEIGLNVVGLHNAADNPAYPRRNLSTISFGVRDRERVVHHYEKLPDDLEIRLKGIKGSSIRRTPESALKSGPIKLSDSVIVDEVNYVDPSHDLVKVIDMTKYKG